MDEPHDKLRDTVEELHQQLEVVDTLDPEVRQHLVDALGDIEAALARRQEGAAPVEEQEASIMTRLRDSVRHFEETHPNLAGAVGSVIDALGRMGI